VNKLNNFNVIYLKINRKHRGPHQMSSRATCSRVFETLV